jgi:asparagine synthase (glutamine-hydrolysing)
MFGLTGFWQLQHAISSEGLQAAARRMVKGLHHRGPDESGTWADESVGLALGHRRLAVVGLSAAGHQPMHSTSRRWVIAFNGEIYNHIAFAELPAAGAVPA